MKNYDIREAKSRNEKKLMRIKGVTGVGIGKENEQEVIVVFTNNLTKQSAKKIPEQLLGYTVITRASGDIRAL